MPSVCTPAGFYASYANVPFFPTSCSDTILDDKATYDTLVRVAPGNDKLGKAVAGVFLHYGWEVAGSLYGGKPVCEYGARSIEERFAVYNISVAVSCALPSETPSDDEIESCLDRIQKKSRSRYKNVSTNVAKGFTLQYSSKWSAHAFLDVQKTGIEMFVRTVCSCQLKYSSLRLFKDYMLCYSEKFSLQEF